MNANNHYTANPDIVVTSETPTHRYFSLSPNVVFEPDHPIFGKFSAHEKLLYLAYMRTAGDHGKSHKALRRLAEECGMSLASAARANKTLVEKGVIRETYITRQSREVRMVDIWDDNIQFFQRNLADKNDRCFTEKYQTKTTGVSQRNNRFTEKRTVSQRNRGRTLEKRPVNPKGFTGPRGDENLGDFHPPAPTTDYNSFDWEASEQQPW